MEKKTGVELIAEERKWQIEVEGWTREHDAHHKDSELVYAAVAYALPEKMWAWFSTSIHHRSNFWPWEKEWWKPTPDNRVRELVKAGALIAAEIDNLQFSPTSSGNNKL